MLRINQIKCGIQEKEDGILKKIKNIYGIEPAEITHFEIVRQAIDARKKPQIFYTYSVRVSLSSKEKEARLLKKYDEAHVSRDCSTPYLFPKPGQSPLTASPVVIGMGPAGLFCALYLARSGFRPIVLERGKRVEERTGDVERFWKEGTLSEDSNVQFGEGGAGTFSDGKLNTLVKDKYGRNHEVLKTLVEFGAPKEIIYQAKPHLGTDVLVYMVKAMREEIIRLGGKIFFETRAEEILWKDNKVCGVRTQTGRVLETPIVVLATGHSARDTFAMLYEKKLPMEAKPFAVGFRVTHPQRMMNVSQYGMEETGDLGPAVYKVTAKTSIQRGVYSFCMCPGGYVVNASSKNGHLAVNGMSYSNREGKYANSAIVVSVSCSDYPGDDAMAGVRFQTELERKAFETGEGKIPAQCYGDFRQEVFDQNEFSEKRPAGADEIGQGELSGKQSVAEKEVAAKDLSYQEAMEFGVKGAVHFTSLTSILPGELNRAFVEGMEHFGKQISGFDAGDVMMYGIESRTSSPVKILRDEETLESSVQGLYPCGEGAGYAGGITSAAMDGLKVAEKIVGQYCPC